MTRSPTSPCTALPADRRVAGLGLTLLVHAVLILCWWMARHPTPHQPDGPRRVIQWIDLPALPQRSVPAPAVEPAIAPTGPHGPIAKTAPAPPIAVMPAPAAAEPSAAATLSADPAPPHETIMETARRLAGSVDRAQRREDRPYIVAPPDSPEIRMRNGMAQAHDMVPPKLWEAPKVDEMVNQTGDGARRTRVRGALGTYCITERATNTGIEQVERDGKQRLTNCPQHEDTATQQDWRTARD